MFGSGVRVAWLGKSSQLCASVYKCASWDNNKAGVMQLGMCHLSEFLRWAKQGGKSLGGHNYTLTTQNLCNNKHHSQARQSKWIWTHLIFPIHQSGGTGQIFMCVCANSCAKHGGVLIMEEASCTHHPDWQLTRTEALFLPLHIHTLFRQSTGLRPETPVNASSLYSHTHPQIRTTVGKQRDQTTKQTGSQFGN